NCPLFRFVTSAATIPVTRKFVSVPSLFALEKTQPAGKPTKPHFTPALTPSGAGPWMWDTVYAVDRFANWHVMESWVCAAFNTTVAEPEAAVETVGTSLSPLSTVVYVVWAEAVAAIARVLSEVKRMSRRRM